MGERWNAEAEDVKPVGAPGVMEGGTPRVTLHVTVSKPGSFDAMVGVLQRAKAEPHFLYDPATDRLGQFFPCDVSARALLNDGTRRTNGHGTVNIQIEVCAMPTGFTEGWTPGPNWLAMLRTIRSWGVPDAWPAGRLSRTSSDAVDRSWASYSKAGWFGHCNVPGNDHWDPGPIDQLAVFAQEVDMPLTPSEINAVAVETATQVWNRFSVSTPAGAEVKLVVALEMLLASANPDAFADKVVAKLGGSTDVVAVKQAVKDALREGVA